MGYAYRFPPVMPTRIEGPSTSFNEILTQQLEPIAYGDFIYGINAQDFLPISYSGGSITSSNGLGIVKSGTSTSGSATLALRKNLKYVPGVGALARLSVIFSEPVLNNLQLAGMGNRENGYYFGYNTLGQFGILHLEHSNRNIYKLQITNAATASENLSIKLDDAAEIVTVITGGTAKKTAYEIYLHDFSSVGSGWMTDIIEENVYFLSGRNGAYSGTYSLSGSVGAGSFSCIQSGSLATSSFIAQDSFNLDSLNTPRSPFILNPQRGNVYEIGYQYLGFGNAFFNIENPETGRFTTVHMIKNANSRMTPVLKNPQMSTRITSLNSGSSTPVEVKSGAMAAFLEGQLKKIEPKFAYNSVFTSFSSTSYKGIVAIKVNRSFKNQTCNGEIDISRIAASSNNNSVSIAVYKNTIIDGTPNFQYIDEQNSIVSAAYLGATGTNIITSNQIPIFTFQIGKDSADVVELDHEEIILGVGESIIIALKTASGANVTGEIDINWHERQ